MRIERVFAVLTAGLMPMLLTAEPKAVSLDECLTIALSDNPTVKIADMEVERLDYSKREVIGQLLPTIDFGTWTALAIWAETATTELKKIRAPVKKRTTA